VSVLVVGSPNRPVLPALPGNVRVISLTDPSGSLSRAVAAATTANPDRDSGGALLVDRKGKLVKIVPTTRSADDFAKQVPALAS
jgi:hypothetical protein